MKRTNLLKSMLLLCALVAGSGSVWADDVYVKVTSTDDLVVGGYYIFAETSTDTKYVANTTYSSNKYGSVTSGFTVSGNTITVTSGTKALVIQLGGTSGQYTFYDVNYKGWLGKGESNTNLARSQSASVPTTNNGYYWDIKQEDGEYHAYSLYKSSGKDHTDRYIGRNSSSIGPYATKKDYPVCNLYKKVSPATFAAGKTMISFSNASEALDLTTATLPSGLAAYKMTAANTTTVTLTTVNSTVAKNTGLILTGTASTTYNIPVVASGTDISATNLLVASDGTSNVTDAYVLSGGQFHPVQAAGIVIPAGKAYLPAGSITSAHPLDITFEEGEATGIKAVDNAQSMFEGAFYNLAGQRVAQPTKGLYIVNGKKVIIK